MGFDHNGKRDVSSCRPKTHFAVAGLIAQSAGHSCGARSGPWKRFELCLYLERTGEYDEHLTSDFDVFGLRISSRDGFQRPAIPGELQRNQELIFGLVAVHVETGQNRNVRRFRNGSAALDSHGLTGLNDELVLLG